MKIRIISIFIISLLYFNSCNQNDSTTRKRFVTIGTGAVTGLYYPTGGAISRMINQKSSEYGIKATVESTAGSVFNVNAVCAGDLDFGVVQSDRQYQAYHGTAEWTDSGPKKRLRSVFAIHPESVTLVVSSRTGIHSVNDLKGKRVNLGNPGSGPLQNARDAIAAFGMSEEDLQAEYIKTVEAPGLLQDGRLDAFFYTVGHPSGNIKEATAGRVPVRILPIEGPGIERLIQSKPYYSQTVIPVSLYPSAQNTKDIHSFGVKGTFVSSADVHEAIVYAVTKEVFEHLETFKSLHPSYRVLTKQNMLEGLTAPLHRGALRYYEESGMIDFVPSHLRFE